MEPASIPSQFRLLAESVIRSLRTNDYTLPIMKFAEFIPDFSASLDILIAATPPNWPEDVDLGPILSIVQDEGIPLVWVPRIEHVTALIEQPDREERLAYLAAHEADIVEDCQAVLADVTNEQVRELARLAIRAADALQCESPINWPTFAELSVRPLCQRGRSSAQCGRPLWCDGPQLFDGPEPGDRHEGCLTEHNWPSPTASASRVC